MPLNRTFCHICLTFHVTTSVYKATCTDDYTALTEGSGCVVRDKKESKSSTNAVKKSLRKLQQWLCRVWKRPLTKSISLNVGMEVRMHSGRIVS